MTTSYLILGTGLLTAGLLVTCTAAGAQTWSTDAKGAAWQGKSFSVRLDAPGVVRVMQGDREAAALAFFQWHDKWIYERMERGTVTAGPTVGADGTLRQAGTWGTTPPAPPLAYELALSPAEGGVDIVLQVHKTAELKLTSGLWAVLTVPRQPATDGRLIYPEPSAAVPVGQSLSGAFRRLLIGKPGETALALVPDGVASARSHLSEAAQTLELGLLPGDFGVGETVTVALGLREAPMPTPPPDPAAPSRQTLAIRGVAPLPASVPLYGTVDLRVDLAAAWDNPYDPEDIRLDARVTTASGASYDLPGFFMVPYQREVDHGMEIMLPDGPGQWHVRLAATEPGPLRCELRAQDRSGSTTFALSPLQVTASDRRGFIRVSQADPHYLVFDNGSPYLPIGHNLPIYPTSRQLVDEAIAKMGDAGENWNRWWMSNSGLGLEWERDLGRYRQTQAARLDVTIDLARRHGFAYMLCMDTHQDFRQGGWKANPFNADNGGPSKTPEEWFTSEAARKYYRNRLRYTVARWAACPEVLCWEFGNEFEGWADTRQQVIIDWHREMAAYLRSLDPYRHPITTSWWSKTGPEACWEIPDLDIVQTHCYTNNDANVAEQVRNYCLKQWQTFAKPHIFGDFGIRSHDTTADKDPKGWALHNAFWAAVASGCDGIPMPWWHENYIEPLNLYGHFTAIRRFTEGLPFGTATWRQIDTEATYGEPAPEPQTRDAVITPADGFRRRAVTTFALAPDGSVNNAAELLSLLHGDGHKDLRNPPTFAVTYPAPGNFTVRVERVSNFGHLLITLDDTVVLDRELPCGEGHGKSWVHRPQWNLWESVYNEPIQVKVPAGAHRIRVENTGKDWVRISSYEFQGCRVLDRPNLLCAAIASERDGIVWIQNRESTWFLHGRGEVSTVPDAVVALTGLPDGPVEIAWWETWQGAPQRLERSQVRGGRLDLRVPALQTDIAARLRFTGGH